MLNFIIPILSIFFIAANPCYGNDWFQNRSLGVYGGFLTLSSNESVEGSTKSGTTHKLSQLDWTADQVWIIGAKAMGTITNSPIHITLEGWTKVTADSVKMVDKDYLNSQFPSRLTDKSVHKNTNLNTALGIDLEARAQFLTFSNSYWSGLLSYLLGSNIIDLCGVLMEETIPIMKGNWSAASLQA